VNLSNSLKWTASSSAAFSFSVIVSGEGHRHTLEHSWQRHAQDWQRWLNDQSMVGLSFACFFIQVVETPSQIALVMEAANAAWAFHITSGHWKSAEIAQATRNMSYMCWVLHAMSKWFFLPVCNRWRPFEICSKSPPLGRTLCEGQGFTMFYHRFPCFMFYHVLPWGHWTYDLCVFVVPSHALRSSFSDSSCCLSGYSGQDLFKQLLEGLDHIHKKMVVHRETWGDVNDISWQPTVATAVNWAMAQRTTKQKAESAVKFVMWEDIKLENLLLDPFNCVKIADFGVAAAGDPTKHQPRLSSIAVAKLYTGPMRLSRWCSQRRSCMTIAAHHRALGSFWNLWLLAFRSSLLMHWFFQDDCQIHYIQEHRSTLFC